MKVKIENGKHAFTGLAYFIFQTFYRYHLKVEKYCFPYSHFCLSISSKMKNFDTLSKQLSSVELDRYPCLVL